MFMHKKGQEGWSRGLLPALGLVSYIVLIAGFMGQAQNIFGKIDNFYGPILFLTLFVFSAMVCSLIVFYEPYKLFLDKKGKEALTLVVSTVKWLSVFVFTLFLVLIFIRN